MTKKEFRVNDKSKISIKNLKYLLLILIIHGPLWAASSGRSGAQVLTFPVGARATGMGGAFSALADDTSSLYWNPAGLAACIYPELSASYEQGLEDANMQFVGYVQPSSRGNIATSLLFHHAGDVEVNHTAAGTSETISAGSDWVLSSGWAKTIAGGGNSRHSLGIGLKYVRSTLAEVYRAETTALDFGYLGKIPSQNINLAIVYKNIGHGLTYKNAGDPLPQEWVGGLAWILPQHPGTEYLSECVSADFHFPKNDPSYYTIGGEFITQKLFAFRAGYEFKRDLPGLSLGFGIRNAASSLDYSYTMVKELSNLHRISLSWRFIPQPVPPKRKIAGMEVK
jgi:hypothetical protein